MFTITMFFADTDQSERHLLGESADNKTDSVQTNEQIIATDKSRIDKADESSNNISHLANLQQSDNVETIQVEGNSHSTNVTAQHIPASGKARNLTSESQMLLSGVQTIPEQLPLILTEGDAEEHESLIIAGNEQLQVRNN